MDVYERLDGYAALRKALDVHPDDLIQLIKDSGLRAVAARASRPASSGASSRKAMESRTNLVVNADEGEPGTCKDLR